MGLANSRGQARQNKHTVKWTYFDGEGAISSVQASIAFPVIGLRVASAQNVELSTDVIVVVDSVTIAGSSRRGQA